MQIQNQTLGRPWLPCKASPSVQRTHLQSFASCSTGAATFQPHGEAARTVTRGRQSPFSTASSTQSLQHPVLLSTPGSTARWMQPASWEACTEHSVQPSTVPSILQVWATVGTAVTAGRTSYISCCGSLQSLVQDGTHYQPQPRCDTDTSS